MTLIDPQNTRRCLQALKRMLATGIIHLSQRLVLHGQAPRDAVWNTSPLLHRLLGRHRRADRPQTYTDLRRISHMNQSWFAEQPRLHHYQFGRLILLKVVMVLCVMHTLLTRPIRPSERGIDQCLTALPFLSTLQLKMLTRLLGIQDISLLTVCHTEVSHCLTRFLRRSLR